MIKKQPAKYPDHAHQKVTDSEIITALGKSRGMVSVAARQLGISRRAIYYRMEQNEEIAQAKEDARELTKDLAELSLIQALEAGEAWAVCFFLKTQAQSRGYIETATVEFEGHLSHSVISNLLEKAEEERRVVDGHFISRRAIDGNGNGSSRRST